MMDGIVSFAVRDTTGCLTSTCEQIWALDLRRETSTNLTARCTSGCGRQAKTSLDLAIFLLVGQFESTGHEMAMTLHFGSAKQSRRLGNGIDCLQYSMRASFGGQQLIRLAQLAVVSIVFFTVYGCVTRSLSGRQGCVSRSIVLRTSSLLRFISSSNAARSSGDMCCNNCFCISDSLASLLASSAACSRSFSSSSSVFRIASASACGVRYALTGYRPTRILTPLGGTSCSPLKLSLHSACQYWRWRKSTNAPAATSGCCPVLPRGLSTEPAIGLDHTTKTPSWRPSRNVGWLGFHPESLRAW